MLTLAWRSTIYAGTLAKWHDNPTLEIKDNNGSKEQPAVDEEAVS